MKSFHINQLTLSNTGFGVAYFPNCSIYNDDDNDDEFILRYDMGRRPAYGG